MAGSSFLRDGLRSVWRCPAVVFAEIVWRWMFGAAALALSTACLFLYLDSLKITPVEMAALRSRVPWLVANAIGSILQGSGSRLLAIVVILTPALSVLWITAASLGRAATLRTLLPVNRGRFWPLVELNLLRSLLFVGSLVAYAGAAILAGHVANHWVEPRPDIFLLVFVSLAVAITVARSRANWLPAIAAIFVGRDALGTGDALHCSADLFSRRSGEFVAVGAIFGVLRFAIATAATVMSLSIFALIARASAWVVISGMAVVTLAYFAVTDFLYVARFAAYIAIAEPPQAASAVLPEPQSAPASVAPGPMPSSGPATV